MRVAVANRHWPTAGGGERYALAVADVFRHRGHEVTLLGPTGAESASGVERLTGATPLHPVVEVDFDDEAAWRETGGTFDVMVNTSHGTQLANPSQHGLLLVHFPRDPGAGLTAVGRRLMHACARRGRSRNREVVWGPGFHANDATERTLRWTKGEATVDLSLTPGERRDVLLVFGNDRPTPADVTLTSDAGGETTCRVTPDRLRHFAVVPVVADDSGIARIGIRSDTFVPGNVTGGADDPRSLGVPVVDIRVGDSLTRKALSRLEWWRRTEHARFLHTYDAIVCNSAYTREWIRRWWLRNATVAEPPVAARASTAKERLILSVGRFFAPERGHSKRQLELVRAFGEFVEHGGEGWELHLVGGCDPLDRPYLEAVQEAAAGLPAQIHVDAPTTLLDSLYARASLYWHAVGLGADVEADPEAAEHFGIAVIEAMSAGAVPLVHSSGGPATTVSDGVDGLHFTRAAGLIDATRSLVADPAKRERMASAARRRAAEFAPDRFPARLAPALEALDA